LFGVFRDADPEVVTEVVRVAGLDGVQLHGDETPSELVRVRALVEGRREDAPGRPLLVVKALGVDPDGGSARDLAARAAAYEGVADLILLDSAVAGRSGGTGVGFRWELARSMVACGPVLVAGGITPETAVDAARRSGAWGIDVSSGIEVGPGVKEEGSMRRLFAEFDRLNEEDGTR
jgi:phosphoribosylanthranilate isomerase